MFFKAVSSFAKSHADVWNIQKMTDLNIFFNQLYILVQDFNSVQLKLFLKELIWGRLHKNVLFLFEAHSESKSNTNNTKNNHDNAVMIVVFCHC